MIGQQLEALGKEIPGVVQAVEDIKREGQRLGAIKLAMWLRQRNFDVLAASQEDILAWVELIPDYRPR